MAEKKRSIVWAYFTPVDKIIANCNVCKRDIRHCNNTTNMFKHMLKHEKENSELQRRRTEHGNPTSTAGPEPVLGSLHGSEPAEKLSLITSCGRPIMESIVGGSSMSPSGSSMSIVYVQTDSDGEIRLLKPAIATTYSRQKEDFQASSSLSDSPVQQEGKQSKLDQSGGLEAETDCLNTLYKRMLELDCEKKMLEIKKLKLEIAQLEHGKECKGMEKLNK
ncbi:uncharacterized protein KZ484_015811 isoform 4-T5 [Pholidichthys leucotaenia]